MVVTGNRGIGKTNLIEVVKKELEEEGRSCHLASEVPSLFYKDLGQIFPPSRFSRIRGISTPYGGITLQNSKESFPLQMIDKSAEKVIFVENAHELDREAVNIILEATTRNHYLRFVLEIATPYMRDIALKASSYEAFEVKELSYDSTVKIARNCFLSRNIAERIGTLSQGYPYVAKCLAYVCFKKNTEEKMLSFLQNLRDDDMRYNLDILHNEITNMLSKDAQIMVSHLAIAPIIMTLRVAEAFCSKKGKAVTFTENADRSLSELRERGILREVRHGNEALYLLFHPLFRGYLRYKQPMARVRLALSRQSWRTSLRVTSEISKNCAQSSAPTQVFSPDLPILVIPDLTLSLDAEPFSPILI